MTGDAPDIYRAALRALRGEALRDRDTLVPPAFAELWERPRFSVWYGGRGAAKSWSIARVLLILASEAPLRVLCCREIQGSIRESAYRLLADQIVMLELDDFYEVQADRIIGRNGTVFYFEGLRYNASKIRSYEGVDVVWIEEAQSVSEMSWETLLPTVRKAGSRFFISFNPLTRDDPVLKRFVENEPPNAIVRKVSYRDNPHLSPEAEAERQWLERTDNDAYVHVWLGEPRTVSDALILRGKFTAEEVEVHPAWAGPYHGMDFGFARDPSAAVRCYVDDATRTLYVTHEFWQLGADIDALPGALEAAIPGVARHVVYGDCSRPETISYLAGHGIPNARSAEKWPGSVDDGIAYLRSFAQIVIDPRCQHLLDECRRYSYKTDRLTGAPLPEAEDRHNHCIDSLRYALSPLIRNKPAGGYFGRAALLDRGEPVEGYGEARPLAVFATAALSDLPGSAVGFTYWALSPHHGHYLVLLDYVIAEVDEACSTRGLGATFARLSQLREEWKPLEEVAALHTEEGEAYDALAPAVAELSDSLVASDLGFLRIESDRLPAGGLDERAAAMRIPVNSGTFAKLSRAAYSRQVTHRSVTANHLMSQVLGYRPGADAPRELAAAFVFGCCVSYDRHRRPPVEAAALVPIAAPESERADARTAEDAATLRSQAFEREVAQWQAEYDSALDAARRRLGNPGWQPRCPQQIGVRPRPLPGFPLAVGC